MQQHFKFIALTLLIVTMTHRTAAALSMNSSAATLIDTLYPGTAIIRMNSARSRVKSLTDDDLSSDWESVTRPKILWAAGLKDLKSNNPGEGYTGHSFNDYNHVDATCMLSNVQRQKNENGEVAGISRSNNLHQGIIVGSLPELGEGGSWSTCQLGCGSTPPRDVAHIQFKSRIAFKLVWLPPHFTHFMLVDDEGELLNKGVGKGNGVPSLQQRERNWREVEGSVFSKEAEAVERKSGSSSSISNNGGSSDL